MRTVSINRRTRYESGELRCHGVRTGGNVGPELFGDPFESGVESALEPLFHHHAAEQPAEQPVLRLELYGERHRGVVVVDGVEVDRNHLLTSGYEPTSVNATAYPSPGS